MKQNTFEPCKDHENGHFGWCLLCEIEQLREELKWTRSQAMKLANAWVNESNRRILDENEGV